MYSEEQVIEITKKITSSVTKAKRIDFSKGVFTCKGKKYYFAPLEMTYPRLAPFKQKQDKILKGVYIEEMATFIVDLEKQMTTGESASYKEDNLNAISKLQDFRKILEGHNLNQLTEQKIDEWFEISTYFILEENEDPYTYDSRIALKKIEDWKSEMYPYDFFLAVLLQSNMYTQESLNIIQIVSQANLQ